MKKGIMLLLILMMTLTSSPLSAEEKMSHKEILSTIVEVAKEEKIPAEILMAMASIETGKEGDHFRHYDENGDVIESDDGGIGMMQITETRDIDYTAEELKDLETNIRASAEILNNKWDYIYNDIIPVLKTWAYKEGEVDYTDERDWRVIEHWYFPVMAYNGLVEENIPKDSNTYPAYQDQVFQRIATSGLLFTQAHAMQIEQEMKEHFRKGETYFTDGEKGRLRFSDTPEDPVKPVELDVEGTYTRMNTKPGDTLVTFNRDSYDSGIAYANMYDSAQLNEATGIAFYTRFTATDEPLLFTDNKANHYGYYTADDEGERVFLSSSNLISSDHPYALSQFSDFDSDVVTTDKDYVTVKFNEEIADSYASGRNFYMTDENGTSVKVKVTKEGEEVRVAPVTVEKSEVYSLYVHKVRDEEGNMASAIKQKVRFE